MKTNPDDPAFSGKQEKGRFLNTDTGEETTKIIWSGLTKREYFAITLLPGLLAKNFIDDESIKEAVMLADQLIRELNK